MKATITEEHAWLQTLVGQWRVEMQADDGSWFSTGTETVRLLGEAWLLLEGTGKMPDGAQAFTQMTLVYDPAQRAFVGSWIGSMMNHLWVYRGGQLDGARRVLALPSEGPSFDTPGKLVQYRDEIELVGAEERLLHGNMLGDDGQWTRFMTARYTRLRQGTGA
jgi:hypothetical protein